MQLTKIPRAILRRSQRKIYSAFRIDALTFKKFSSRDDLVEIGSHQGGWVVPVNMLNSDSICYLAGCGTDITFDLALIERFGCDVHAFDPTPRAIEHVQSKTVGNSKYHFQEVGIWDKEDTLEFFVPANPNHISHSLVNLQKTAESIRVKVKRLSSLMKELGHQKIDLLKIDIEGAEYKVLESVIEDQIDVRVLCVEFDEYAHPLDKDYKSRIRSHVNALLEYGFELANSDHSGNYTFVKSQPAT